MKRRTFHEVFTAAMWFPKTARGHGARRRDHGGRGKCVCKDCGTTNPHTAHVSYKATPFHLPLEGREANAFLHMGGER